jgi:hypothetical protein
MPLGGRSDCQAICVMTNMEKSKSRWGGETGYIDKTMLTRFVPDVAAPIYSLRGLRWVLRASPCGLSRNT